MNSLSDSTQPHGDVELSSSDFDAIAALALREFGLSLPSSKRQLVQSRLVRRIRALDLQDFNKYRELLESSDGKEEQSALLSALTTNVTKFFREIHHFEDLKELVMPELVERARKGERVRMWSAGCSSGQEPYSIAMVALQSEPNISKYDFKILATDIDPKIVAKARDGIYLFNEIQAVPSQFYRPQDVIRSQRGESEIFSPSAAVKELIQFGELNLISKLPFSGAFNVIFCRNVAIYFDAPTQNKVWRSLSQLILRGGKFYIGHSERIKDPEHFDLAPTGITTYQKQ